MTEASDEGEMLLPWGLLIQGPPKFPPQMDVASRSGLAGCSWAVLLHPRSGMKFWGPIEAPTRLCQAALSRRLCLVLRGCAWPGQEPRLVLPVPCAGAPQACRQDLPGDNGSQECSILECAGAGATSLGSGEQS